MLKIYCQKCGGLNSYVSEKPNFCQKCGNNFGHETEAALMSHEIEIPDEPSEAAEGNLTNMEQLDIDIEIRGPNTITIGNIVDTKQDSTVLENNQDGMEDYDILKVFEKEASAIRPNEKGKKET